MRPRTGTIEAKAKDTIFLIIVVGNFSIIFCAKVFKILHFVKFFMVIRKWKFLKFKRKGQQSCSIRKSNQAECGAVITY